MSGRLVTPVILAGGSGTRLWPLSTPEKPKQFLTLLGDSSLFQQALERVQDGSLFAPPIVVCNIDQADVVERQLAEMEAQIGSLILEPLGRNTATAIALAAAAAPSDALLLAMPSDHRIENAAEFVKAARQAAAVADDGWLVTFGVQPSRPETGYGYIQVGAPITDNVFEAVRFVEKPPAAEAAAYLESGAYRWNSGVFLFQKTVLEDVMRRHAPDVLAKVRSSLSGQNLRSRTIAPAGAELSGSPSISIDHAVMERAERVAVLPVDWGWSDLGTWDALYEAMRHSEPAPVLNGNAVAMDCESCLLRSDGPLLVAIGVTDLIVVASGDAVLVMPRGQSQRAAAVAGILKNRSLGSPRE